VLCFRESGRNKTGLSSESKVNDYVNSQQRSLTLAVSPLYFELLNAPAALSGNKGVKLAVKIASVEDAEG
jgi:hypothetical protein